MATISPKVKTLDRMSVTEYVCDDTTVEVLNTEMVIELDTADITPFIVNVSEEVIVLKDCAQKC